MSPSKPAVSAPAVFLALGSNLGDRRGHLAQAGAALGAAPGIRLVAASSLYATAPVGLPGEPEFLNAVVEIRTELAPEALLQTCLEIERGLGRVRDAAAPKGQWRSRPIDIDVLLWGELRQASPTLTVPHPRLQERAFVLLPLAEIAPGWRLEGRTIAEWAAASDASGVRRLPGGAAWIVRESRPAGPR